ncbi:MAG: hypothetical protein CW335_07750, partial [Clostridiales bacterium]|nr:hypothetical protein [Clostridiales bacterium]
MKKKITSTVLAMALVLVMATPAFAATHTVAAGDTMWKLAVKYQVGTSEIISANPQIGNPNLIY